jgi:thiol reductant ABC exporter CydC subunit
LRDLAVMLRMTRLLQPVLPLMLLSIGLGVAANAAAIAFMAVGALLLVQSLGGAASPGLIAAFGGLAAVRGLLRYGEQLAGHDVAFRLLAAVRDRLYAALRRLAPAKLIDKRSGDLVSTVMADVEYIEVFYAHTIAPVVIGVLVPTGVLLFLSRFWPGFALAMLLMYSAVLVLPVLLSGSANAAGRAYRRDLARMNSHLLDHLQGLKEVIQFGRGEMALQTISSNSEAVNASTGKLRRHEGLVAAGSDAVVLAAAPVLLLLGLGRLQAGLLAPPDLLLIVVTGASSFAPILTLGALANPLAHTIAAAERIFKLIDEEPAVHDTGTGELPAGPLEIAFADVTFSYTPTGEGVLRDFSLIVKEGEKVALVGKSGSGKTTTLRLLHRFWDPAGGTISISGRDIRELPQERVRSLMSLVMQDTYLFSGTIAENLRVVRPQATHRELGEAIRAAALEEFVASLPRGLDTPVGELGDRLSGGERQRIAIARAFLHQAPILLLDEATSSLDVLNERRVLRTIAAAFKDKTVITVAHRPSTIVNSDRICLLDGGRIVEEGSPTEHEFH